MQQAGKVWTQGPCVKGQFFPRNKSQRERVISLIHNTVAFLKLWCIDVCITENPVIVILMYATHWIQSYDDNKTAIIRHECPGSTCVVCSPRFLRFFSRKSQMGLLESAASINWEHESFPEYGDFVALPVFAFFFFSVRFFLDRFVFQVPCFINPVELFFFFFFFFSFLFCWSIVHNLVLLFNILVSPFFCSLVFWGFFSELSQFFVHSVFSALFFFFLIGSYLFL